jgi:hypothetical protein
VIRARQRKQKPPAPYSVFFRRHETQPN